MSRGRGLGTEEEQAPLRDTGAALVLAHRLKNLSVRLEDRASKLEEKSLERQTHRRIWQQMKAEGVPLGDRLALRVKNFVNKMAERNDEHLERLEEIKGAYMAYLNQGRSAQPVAQAWQLASIYTQKPVVQEQAPIAAEPVPVSGKTASESPRAAEPVEATVVTTPIEAPPAPANTNKPTSKQENAPAPAPAKARVNKLEGEAAAPPPASLGGIPLTDVVEHSLDETLGVEVPKLIGDKQEDANMASWLKDFEAWSDYDSVTRRENLLKRNVLAKMLRAYHADPEIAANNRLGADDFIQVASETGVSSSQAAALFLVMRNQPDVMQKALRSLAPTDDRPIDQRINDFCAELGDVRNAFYRYKGPDQEGFIGQTNDGKLLTDGGKLALASVLLYAVHGEKTPPYRHQMAQGGYRALGVPRPASLPTVKKKEKMIAEGKPVYPTPGDIYVNYLGLLDVVAEKMDEHGARGHDRLTGFEALLWAIDGPKWHRLSQKGQAMFPKWPAEKIRAFLRWNETVTKR